MQDQPKRRFPKPWKVIPISGGFSVADANGVPLAYIYADTNKMTSVSYEFEKLTVDEAWRIAKAISRLPEFLSEKS